MDPIDIVIGIGPGGVETVLRTSKIVAGIAIGDSGAGRGFFEGNITGKRPGNPLRSMR